MKRKITQERVYNFLKQNIQEEKWISGMKLIEQDIADELSVSRTPVRQAMDQLVEEDYLVRLPNRGVYVRGKKMSRREFVERIQLLELLMSNYFFQIESKSMMVESDELYQHFEKIKRLLALRDFENLNKEIQRFISCLFSENRNQIILNLILSNYVKLSASRISDLKPIVFYEQVVRFFERMLPHLESYQWAMVRKELRIFLNNLVLEVVDRQL